MQDKEDTWKCFLPSRHCYKFQPDKGASWTIPPDRSAHEGTAWPQAPPPRYRQHKCSQVCNIQWVDRFQLRRSTSLEDMRSTASPSIVWSDSQMFHVGTARARSHRPEGKSIPSDIRSHGIEVGSHTSPWAPANTGPYRARAGTFLPRIPAAQVFQQGSSGPQDTRCTPTPLVPRVLTSRTSRA